MNIGIIGVGKLGLAYALVFEEVGFQVFASSYKQEYVEDLQKKITDSLEPGIAEMLKNSKNIDFTVDNHNVIKNCDIIYVMVATPSTPMGDYDIGAVRSVAHDFLNHPGPVAGKTLIIGSTVNPGNCVELHDLLKQKKVNVVYCPTFAAQGSVLRDVRNPHTMSLGTTDEVVARKCKDVFAKIAPPDTPIYVMHPTTAEILKLAGNCRATMEISFVNMVGQMLVENGLTKDIETANQYLSFVKKQVRWKYGFGYGGPCYPRDNRSLVHYAQKIGMDYPLGQLIDDFNQSHVKFLTKHLIKDNCNGVPFYFDHVSYKKGVAMFEESHQLKVCKKLLKKGHTVYIELTDFLLPKIVEDLSQEFGDRVRFVHFVDLTEPVYKINY
jgi:UDPglucose 6-dehydrogenase